MSENEDSSENLRKFLENDDPALRIMGLSLAKGAKSLDKTIIGIYFWDPEKEIREAAGEFIREIGIEKFNEFPEWPSKKIKRLLDSVQPSPDYSERHTLVLQAIGEENMSHIQEWYTRICDSLERIKSFTDERCTELLIKALEDDTRELAGLPMMREYTAAEMAAYYLGVIGDARAVEPLINALKNKDHFQDWISAARALGLIKDKRAVEPLIKTLEDKEDTVEIYEAGNRDDRIRFRIGAVTALGLLKDKRAVEPLIKTLEEARNKIKQYPKRSIEQLRYDISPEKVRREAVRALGMIKDKRAVTPLTEALEDGNMFTVMALLQFSDLPLEYETPKLLEHCKLLLTKETIFNLEQMEFVKIIEHWKTPLETMEHPCTAEELIELLSGASFQTRWIVACAVVEISRIPHATIDKMLTLDTFWKVPLTVEIKTKDRDEIVRIMKLLPPIIAVRIGQCLYNIAMTTFRNKEASDVMKKNRKMITTIFEDTRIAKDILGKMR